MQNLLFILTDLKKKKKKRREQGYQRFIFSMSLLNMESTGVSSTYAPFGMSTTQREMDPNTLSRNFHAHAAQIIQDFDFVSLRRHIVDTSMDSLVPVSIKAKEVAFEILRKHPNCPITMVGVFLYSLKTKGKGTVFLLVFPNVRTETLFVTVCGKKYNSIEKAISMTTCEQLLISYPKGYSYTNSKNDAYELVYTTVDPPKRQIMENNSWNRISLDVFEMLMRVFDEPLTKNCFLFFYFGKWSTTKLLHFLHKKGYLNKILESNAVHRLLSLTTHKNGITIPTLKAIPAQDTIKLEDLPTSSVEILTMGNNIPSFQEFMSNR